MCPAAVQSTWHVACCRHHDACSKLAEVGHEKPTHALAQMYNGEVVACKEIDLEESEEMQEVRPALPLRRMLAAASAAAARHTGCMELPTTATAHRQPELSTCCQLHQPLTAAHLLRTTSRAPPCLACRPLSPRRRDCSRCGIPML